MSKSMNSPSARLLQYSRLFSIPRPLPQPTLEASSTGVYRSSDSATLPYPTQQAITTPASSHFRGDFGLKRPLPSRATRTSTPHIRVNAHDNFAHITDFGSAANHTQTEAKWREMNMPIFHKPPKTNYSGSTSRPTQSVYDDELDNTDRKATQISAPQNNTRQQTNAVKQRWKYEGPWVTGMSEGEFELYLVTQISERKAEFKDFLKDRMLDERLQQEERASREQGSGGVVTFYRKEELRQEIEADYENEEKRLRDEHAAQHLTSDLTRHICDFLDLPGVRGSIEDNVGMNIKTASLAQQLAKSISFEDSFSPPTTHPGAGLSHLRTHAFMENHPLYGPQERKSPVLARVLRARNSAAGSAHAATLGVGGIVTSDTNQAGGGSWARYKKHPDPEDPTSQYLDANGMTEALDQDIEGGNKIWVQPELASIDEKGRIKLQVSRGDQEAIAVKTDRTEPIHEARSASLRSPGMAPLGSYNNARYGVALPDTRFARPRSNVQGFDEELVRSPQQGQMDQGAAVAKIRELMDQRR